MSSRGRKRNNRESMGGEPGALPSVIAVGGMAGPVSVAELPAPPSAPAEPATELASVRLTTQIGLLWPQDGVRHYYGPGEAQLPAAVVAGLRRATHRLVA